MTTVYALAETAPNTRTNTVIRTRPDKLLLRRIILHPLIDQFGDSISPAYAKNFANQPVSLIYMRRFNRTTSKLNTETDRRAVRRRSFTTFDIGAGHKWQRLFASCWEAFS